MSTLLPARPAPRVRPTAPAALVAFAGAALLVLCATIMLPALGRFGVFGALDGPEPPSSLPDCTAGEVLATPSGYDDWGDTILDTRQMLPAEYEPPDLVEVDAPGKRIRLRSFVVPDLRTMLEAALADGTSISVTSGYRSFRQQSKLFERIAAINGETFAAAYAARPGHSEHQLGTTVDLAGDRDWLRRNAWRFGFVMSYPPGRSPALTCYRPEPWHYRYFGRERASAIRASGLSPREWLWANYR